MKLCMTVLYIFYITI